MTENKCEICGFPESDENPLFSDGFYQNTWFHIGCLNSEAAQKWREARRVDDPRYRRYHELLTAGRQLSCLKCGETNYLYPKFIGHSPSWELCCNRCSNVDVNGINPYELPDIAEPLLSLYDEFMQGKELSEMKDDIKGITTLFEAKETPAKCECGGVYSIAARPRCRACKEVLLESIFHYSDGPPANRS